MTFLLRHADAPALRSAEPLAMPDQDFAAPFRDPQARAIVPDRRTALRRGLCLSAPAAASLALGWVSLGWFGLDGQVTVAEGALVAVTVFAMYWLGLSVATAALGLLARPQRPLLRPAARGLSVAILLPMYGEPARATIGNGLRLLSALADARSRHSFSLHVLSDTRDEAAAMAEEAAIRAFRRRYPGLEFHYRRRAANTDYKSGNIRDWVQSSGHDHEAMLVLDADSVMGAGSVLMLANAMAADPSVGLIQTITRVLPGHTLWQRMQSFASEVYGRNLGRGFAAWAGSDANFMGHNALLRTRAFAASAGLPHLPGRRPLGGVILSHDFVEAALMRRAGWAVRMLPEAEDSFEDTPETLLGYVRRDRRWCQGNMQHLRLIGMPGLHPMSRFHLMQGAMAYLASVWWMGLLVLWALPGQGGAFPDIWAENPFMPVWPQVPPVSQAALAAVVAAMLVGPKLIGVAAHLRTHGFPKGQRWLFCASIIAECALSMLMAPMLMLHQVRAVLRTLAGRDGGWMPHLSGRAALPVLLRFHAAETGLGLALLGLCGAGLVTGWLLPIALSLTLAVPLSWLVQRDAPAGGFLRPMGAAAA